MDECDELIEQLQIQAPDQVRLALAAAVPEVAAMQLDLAMFNGCQVRVAEELCD